MLPIRFNLFKYLKVSESIGHLGLASKDMRSEESFKSLAVTTPEDSFFFFKEIQDIYAHIRLALAYSISLF